MKKRVLTLLMTLLLCVSLCAPAWASNGIMNYVIDAEDVLSYEGWDSLEDMAADISQRHDCGVYIYFTEDYTYYGDGSPADVARQLYEDPSAPLGEGEDMEGILLLLSLYERDWTLYVNGEKAEYAFSTAAQETLSEEFLPAFAEDDWEGGFYSYLLACDEYLTLAEQGAPVGGTEQGDSDSEDIAADDAADVDIGAAADDDDAAEDAQEASPVKGILTVVGISCLIALLVCLALKGKMKSVHRKVEAKSYVTAGGLDLTERYDRFTHTTETVRIIENKSDSGNGGSGNGGKF